jgi:4-amino-4-deoxy-L-arabinose transferase-like glycosyltransferase
MTFWCATAWGIGLSPDSGFYIKSARHMLGREQVDPAQTRELSSHFPPMYAAVLAGVSVFGADPQNVARWVNLTLFAANVLLMGFIAWRVTNRSLLAVALAGLFVIFAPHSLVLHAIALSEALFVCLLLICFWMLERYLSTNTSRWLIAAGIAGGLAVLTRYAGVAIVPAGSIVIFWLAAGTRRKRARDAIVFAALCLLPVVIIAAVNNAIWGTTVNRTTAFHLVSRRHLQDGLITLGQWVSPKQIGRKYSLAVGLIVAGTCLLLTPPAMRGRKLLPKISILFIASYLAVLLVSISLIDFHTPIDERLLFPVLIAVVIMVAGAVPNVDRSRAQWIAAAAIAVVALTVARGSSEVSTMHRDGIGYASAAWQQSELVQAVKSLPAEKAVYSNAADVVYLVARRQAMPVPAKVNATSLLPNPEYENQLAAMDGDISSGRAVLAYFKKFEAKRPYYPREAELSEKLRLKVQQQANDGTLYDAIDRN